MKININEQRFIPCDYFKEESEGISRGLIFNMQTELIEQSLYNLDEEDFLKLKNIIERIFFERWKNGEFEEKTLTSEPELETLIKIHEYSKENNG